MATQPQDLTGLSHLGNTQNKPQQTLETFPNRNAGRNYTVELSTDEFTCLCPLTSQPDFAQFEISYVPDEKCVELKSLKSYFWSFRNEGAFHEKVTNTIADDIIAAIAPRKFKIVATWNVRGGIGTIVTVEHEKRR